jgi:hypothetical protein
VAPFLGEEGTRGRRARGSSDGYVQSASSQGRRKPGGAHTVVRGEGGQAGPAGGQG